VNLKTNAMGIINDKKLKRKVNYLRASLGAFIRNRPKIRSLYQQDINPT
jgi:hypothetical protein